MLWTIIALLALSAALALHLWWRNRFQQAQLKAETELAAVRRAYHQSASQIQTQQETLFNSMTEGLLVLDQRGRIQIANRAFTSLFGVTADVRSRTIMEALRLHELADLVGSFETRKEVLGYELKLARPNERWLQVNGAAIFDAGGQRQGTILVFHELTRLKQLERTRQEFVANVSHELRTPLSLIKGYVETLLDGAQDNPEVAAKFLHTIDRNAERLKLLIEDLLTISELESGRVKLNLQSVPLRAVTGKVLADYKARAEARQVKLSDEVPDLRVRADADRLEQVLGNFIDNAIKYGRQEGAVKISARAADAGEIEVAVQDDGPGIPPEALERVFERFYRVDKARSREQGGTGLGLSIVKHIVQSHGGRVWAKSKVGQGASFYFTLPQDTGSFQRPLL
ncbi:MAG TPA: ATP-binding protein [Candidatus Acidoferrum sp.]|jgi:two-component system phosphate regulon sensor histidine kinase PhoR|nr:ATP-binding protein [Candidatus Acidoferrum sp.]